MDLATLWQGGKLDARCRDCGAESAATSRCYKCGSVNLDYIAHRDQTDAAYLCGGRNHNGRRPPRAAGPARRPARGGSGDIRALPVSAPVAAA